MQLDWFDEGAMQLVLPERLLGQWHGSASSDYDRACALPNGWIHQLPVADGFGFVLNDQPTMVLIVPENDGSLALVRWVFADDEHELVAFALRGEFIKDTEPDLIFSNSDLAWRLIDAACDLLDDEAPSRPMLLPTGRIRVQTAYYESDHHAAVVHRISKAA